MIKRIALLLCLALAGCTDDGSGGVCGLRLAGEVPLRVMSNLPLAEMTVGEAHVTLMVDTGSTHTLIRPSAVKTFGLTMVDGGAHQLLGTSGPSVAQVAKLAGARLGGVSLPTVDVPVPPDTDAGFLGGIGGLLGMDILGKYEIDLDLPAHAMRLYAGHPCDGELLPIGAALIDIRGEWTRQHAYNDIDPRMFVRGTLDGQEVSALLDSGSQRSVLYEDAAPSLGVTLTMLAQDPDLPISGVGATKVRAKRHRLHELRFGDTKLTNWEIWVLDRTYSNDAAMVLGGDFLARHRVWLAPRRHKVFVTAGGKT